ncbi:MAG: exodeoxyribonuclease VII small subunit [Eubacterium sp.]
MVENNSNSNNTIEENFAEIEDILKEMQSEQVTLDKSFELYNKGLKLIQNCNHQIDTIERKIKILEEDNENE